MITKKYYKLVRVSHADSDYFRVTNVDTTAGTLTINGSNNLGADLEYSTDGVNWTTADSNAPFSLTVPAGANVYMRGTTRNWAAKTINMNVNHTVGGNILSLLNKTNYSTLTFIDYSYKISQLFYSNTHLISAKDLNFGNATTCTCDMFMSACFQGCTSLITPPETLPFTTLAPRMYRSAFQDCSSMTSTPSLPATTLTENCYERMFSGCSSIQFIVCLAESFGYKSTDYWVSSVAATGTFYKSANMSSWPTSVSGIPSGWTVVDY